MKLFRKNGSTTSTDDTNVWPNLALTIELHAPAVEDSVLESVIDAWDDRPDWIEFGSWYSTNKPPVLRCAIPLANVVDRGHSADEVRRAACSVLLRAGIDATVRVHTEWAVDGGS